MNDTTFKITPEFIIDLVLRRRWLILVSICLALIIGIYLAVTLPKIYQASTLILIEPQRVPQNYVQSIVTEDASDRIDTLRQQIMSRTNLERIISDFNMYSKPEQRSMFMEDKIRALSQRIDIDVTTDRRSRTTDAFSISFKGQDPQKVMQIANALANSFINENLKIRESQAVGTSDFLESELETMRMRLEQLEERIKEYRRTYMGELPEQLDSNLRILDRLQENLNDRQQGVREARVRLAELNAQASTRPQQVVVIGGEQGIGNRDRSVEELKADLETLSSRYTEKHPDIVRLKRRISEMEANNAIESTSGDAEGSAITPSMLPPATRRQINEVQGEIRLAESEIETLKRQIADYQQRVENTPKREQELLSLRRDYENIQTSYESLLNRKLEADIAVNMERKQKGEQFRIVDPARMPQKPIEPDMKKLFLIVVAIGCGLGGGAAFLLEYSNTSFRRPDNIESLYAIPVLASIPTIYRPRQIFFKKLSVVTSILFSLVTVGFFAVFAFACFVDTMQIKSYIDKFISG